MHIQENVRFLLHILNLVYFSKKFNLLTFAIAFMMMIRRQLIYNEFSLSRYRFSVRLTNVSQFIFRSTRLRFYRVIDKTIIIQAISKILIVDSICLMKCFHFSIIVIVSIYVHVRLVVVFVFVYASSYSLSV